MSAIIYCSLWLLATLAPGSAGLFGNDTQSENRSGKVFSLFNLVTWKQTSCQAASGNDGVQNTLYGTCMTAAQCSSTSGGAASGACAAGFGVCCVVSLNTCGGTITQNCTYVFNPGYPSTYNTVSDCKYTIKKCSSSICMIRLDFDQFTISAPNTVSPLVLMQQGVCAIDAFTPQGVKGTLKRPVICGDNTGQHMYLDAVDGSNSDLAFDISIGNAFPNNMPRLWKIKISQLPCGKGTPAPSCTQYFTGKSGQVKSYNYGSAPIPVTHLLVNQKYQVCIRQEDQSCQNAYSVCGNDPTAFGLTGQPQQKSRAGQGCIQGYITIPDGHNADRVCKNGGSTVQAVNRYCGLKLNCIDLSSNNQIVYQTTQPFGFHVYSDPTDSNFINNMVRGFCLNYNQIPC